MRLSHLTDTEIQTYLDSDRDGQLGRFRGEAKEHLAACGVCNETASLYGDLYDKLTVTEPGRFSDLVVNKVMASLPKPNREKNWRSIFAWLSHAVSLLVFGGILLTPFELNMPAFNWSVFEMPALTLPSFELPASITRLSDLFLSAASLEHLPFYGFMLLTGLIMYNMDRIIFGRIRQNI